MMYVLAVAFGGLEVLLVTWLVLVIANGGGLWFIAGLMLYFLWSALIGGTLKSVALMLLSAVLLASGYASFGIVAAIFTYLGLIVLGEILTFLKSKTESEEDE